MDMIKSLEVLVERYCLETNRSEGGVLSEAIGNNHILKRAREKPASTKLTIRSYERIIQWLSDRWPDDCDWPDSIVRPEKSKVEVAIIDNG
jgi:hypothetical protein